MQRASQNLVECNSTFTRYDSLWLMLGWSDSLPACLSHVDAFLTLIHRNWKLNTTDTGWPRHTKLVVTKGKPLYVERVTKKKRGKKKTKTLGEVNATSNVVFLIRDAWICMFTWCAWTGRNRARSGRIADLMVSCCLQVPLPARFPHTDVKLTLEFTAPSKTREHASTWRAQLPDGQFVGNEFTIELYVVKKIGASTMVKDLDA